MTELLKKRCRPCEDKNAPPMAREAAEKLLAEVPGWGLVPRSDLSESLRSDLKIKISREFKFQDFIGAVNFVERVADVAEQEGHHPDIHIFYNRVVLELWTHSIGGLSENDFILAAKINALRP